jgi:hypothetical protein
MSENLELKIFARTPENMANREFIVIDANTVVYNPSMDTLETIVKSSGGISRQTNDKLRLISFEMNFMTSKVEMTPPNSKVEVRPLIVYIGYAPGTHLLKLMRLYGDFEFHLFDDVDPPNSVLAYANSPDSNCQVFFEYPTDEQIQAYREHENVYLISNYTNPDVRNDNAENRHELHIKKEETNAADMAVNMDYARRINARSSLLKFRPPHYHAGDRVHEFEFFRGIILLPIFSKPKSSECRMIVSNYSETIQWDYRVLTYGLNSYNQTTREKLGLNPFTNNGSNFSKKPLGNQLGNQMEICVLFAIIRDYFIAIGLPGPTETHVYNLYSRFIIGDIENAQHCGLEKLT